MNLQLVTALVILYRGCADPEVRRRALKLVPTLKEVVDAAEEPQARDDVRRWNLTAWADGYVIQGTNVVCRESELEQHRVNFREQFDLAVNVKVTTQELT